MVHLIESAVWGQDLDVTVPTRAHARTTGGLRGDSYELRLASWLVRQLERRYVTYLDWRLQRQLTGLAKRLWIYLEAERYKPASHGREQTWIALGDKAYTALGVNHARERARRAALAQAGERIVAADIHYAAIVIEPHPYVRHGWRLLATRIRDPEARTVAREARLSLAHVAATRGEAWSTHGQGELLDGAS